MSHLIETIDRTYSNKGKEWHGLATVPLTAAGCPVTSLTRDNISDILFPLAETTLHGDGPDGSRIPLPDNKLVCADLRHRGEGFAPLGIHGDKYLAIENTQIFEAVENALDGTAHTLTTAGTLDGCRRFYMTVQLSDAASLTPGNEAWKAFLCFVTSHDGSLALRAYDSGTRIVCNNTLMMSLGNKGSHSLRITHTRGNRRQLANFPNFLDSVLKGREKFAEAYSSLMARGIARADAFAGLVGMFWQATGQPEALSSRAENAVAGINRAFERGMGNKGQTFADLLNGFTEYYTSGEGCGVSAKPFERAIASQFGGQAEKKNQFFRDLVNNDGAAFADNITAGREYLSGIARNRAVSGTYGQRATAPALALAAAPSAPAAGTMDGGDLFASLMSGGFTPKQ